MDLFKALPTAESVLQLEPEELAPYLLEYLAANSSRLNLNNMFGSSLGDGVTFHYKNDPRVEQAFREAWSWLAREGLLIEKEHGWFFISRRGGRLKGRQDFAAYQRSNVLPKGSLHPVVAERVWSNFVRGEYDTAVFQAFKEVEVAVRAAGRFGATDIGTALREGPSRFTWAHSPTRLCQKLSNLLWLTSLREASASSRTRRVTDTLN